MEILGGPLFAVAGAGESHGPGIVTIVFGCPPGLEVSRLSLQKELDRRRPGATRHGTTRRESDQVAILSGLFSESAGLLGEAAVSLSVEGKTLQVASYESGYATGEPIAAIVLSSSGKPEDYRQFAGPEGEVRPGHTDLVKYWKSRGFADYRGGGRSSYRSTVSDVIGGSIARNFLQKHFGTAFLSAVTQVGDLVSPRSLSQHFLEILSDSSSGLVPQEVLNETVSLLEDCEIPSLVPEFAEEAVELIRQVRVEGDSIGAALEVVAVNVPALVGDPLYQSLKVRLTGTLGGLHAVQSCEVGSGFDVVRRKGSMNNDPIRAAGYQGNTHGGLMGGVTTGMPLVFRVGFKPTSSIRKKQLSVRKDLEEIDFQLLRGRHDPCVGIRAGVTLESRMAIELLNAVLMHQATCVDPEVFRLFPAPDSSSTP